MVYTVPPRPGVMNIRPYVGGDAKLPGTARVIKLSSNEGPFGPSPLAVQAMAEAAKTAHRYPDGTASALREAIAQRFSLDAARIVCGAGSDELLSLLCSAYAGPGDEVLYSQHGFLMYPIAAHAAGATPIKAPETNLRTDVEAIVNAVTPRTRVVFIANPNNPTGTYLTRDEMERLRAGLPENVLLVIDAAYAEFVTRNDYSPGMDLVDAGRNTVMTRTFSKIFALGGLRVGWGYFPGEIAAVINRVRGPFNISSVGQAAAIKALEDTDFMTRSREHTQHWVTRTEEALHALGLSTTQSVGNFVLAQFSSATEAQRCNAFLRERGVIVRCMTGYGLPQSLRISIGTNAEMEFFLSTVTAFRETAT